MSNFGVIKIETLRWLMPILFLYFFAGTFQYLGIFSPTMSNFIVLILLAHVFLFYSTLYSLKIEFPLFLFLLLVVGGYTYYQKPITYTLTYAYYLICTIIAASAGRAYVNWYFNKYKKFTSNSFIKLSKFFLLIQLLVTFFQSTFTELYLKISRTVIGFEDAVFGTLYLQSDAALATICEMMIFAVYVLPSSIRDKILITMMGLGVVFLGNSKAAQITILIVILISVTHLIFKKVNFYKNGFGCLIGFFILTVPVIFYTNIHNVLFDFIENAKYDFYRKDEWITAPRFAPIGEIFQSGLSWLGKGPLSYYNPIDKEWLYNSGFSTFYILYFDYGLLGFLFYFGYQTFLIVKFGTDIVSKFILFIIFLSYMNFNFALTDISFVFMFNFVLLLIYKCRFSNDLFLEKKSVH